MTRLEQEVLKSITKSLQNKEELFYSFVSLEQFLKGKLSTGEVCKYELGEPWNFKLHVWMENKKMNISIKQDKTYISLRLYDSDKNLFELCDKIETLLRDKKIPLTPKPPKEFVNHIQEVEVGQVINCNNSLSLVCTESTKSQKKFKRLFEGSLENITLDSFKTSEEFVLNTEDIKDIWYLHNLAYDYKISAAPIRLYKDNGLFLCTDIESSIPVNSSRKVHIGPLTLIVIKESVTDEETKQPKITNIWYDAFGNKINRELAGIILGWAKNSIMQFDIKEWVNEEPITGFEWKTDMVSDYQSFYHTIRDHIIEKNFSKVLDEAFQFSRISGNTKTLTFHALIDDNTHNFISTTYAFKSTEDAHKIFKLTYENNSFTNWVEKAEEVSEEEFLTVCEQFYNTNIKFLCNNYANAVSIAEQQGIPAEEAIKEIMQAHSKDSMFHNALGIKQSEIQAVKHNVELLLQNLSDTKKEVDALSFTDQSENNPPLPTFPR